MQSRTTADAELDLIERMKARTREIIRENASDHFLEMITTVTGLIAEIEQITSAAPRLEYVPPGEPGRAGLPPGRPKSTGAAGTRRTTPWRG